MDDFTPLSEAERKVASMILDLVRSIRRAKRTEPEVARAAADWEIELERRLSPPLQLVAEEEEVAEKDEPTTPPPATGTTS